MKRLQLGFVLIVGLTLAASASVVVAKPPPGSPSEGKAKTTQIQILGLNDFHGQLEPLGATQTSSGRIGATSGPSSAPVCEPPTCFPAGGVEYLATHVRNLRAQNPTNTVFVSAGDLIGATPLLSALFHDEPSIEAFNLMALDYNGVGNHEFDEGVDELLRMQYGSQLGGDGCHPDDGCMDETPFDGAEFDFLAANVKYKDSGDTIFPPYAIHSFDGVNVAFVGMTLQGTDKIVSPEGISDVDFLPEAATVNALVPELKAMGIETIVVLLHEGGSVSASGNGAGSVAAIDQCLSPTGALPPIVEAMDDEIDVVITGHTNWAMTCTIDGKIVTGAASQGRLITDIDLTISRATKDVVNAVVDNKIVTRDVAPASDLTALIAHYKPFHDPIANAVTGSITADIRRTPSNAAGESAIGDVIADAQLAYTQGVGAQLAFMNPGGIRADLVFSQISGGEAAGEVTYGEAFNVQPFNNLVVTHDMTGQQIKDTLEQSWQGCFGRVQSTVILQVSAGFTYSYNASLPCGSRITAMTLGGSPIVMGTTYKVTLNNFIADGGDSFPGFTAGTNRVFAPLFDVDALAAYLDAGTPPGVAPGPQNRITITP